MAERGDDYFRQREAELKAQGRDADDDDEWAKPDYEDRVRGLDGEPI
jgi:hypothetical protein